MFTDMTGSSSWTRPPISTSSSRSSAGPKNKKGFQVLPRRWVVERTFGWMTRWRRLVCDYEQRIDVSHAMMLVAMGGNLLRRTAHP
jgi:transposase